MKWIFVAILIYIVIFGAVTSLRHYNFQTQAWDLGIFTQVMWNILHGNGMSTTLEFVENHFAVHMSPILFLLAPGYAVFQNPYYLLIIQTLVLALGALPLYLTAALRLQGKLLPILITFAYLLYPSLHWVNWFDFHPIAFLIPFFLAAFYFYETKKYGWMSLFLALAASTQEDAILVVAFFGVYLMIKDIGRPKDVRCLKIGLAVILLSVFYFLISIKVIMPYFGGGLLRIDRYAHLGSGFGEIFKNIFLHPFLFINTLFQWQKFTYLFGLFLPVAFLPFFAWREMILLIPGIAQNLLTNYQPQFSGTFQYDASLIAGIFIATIYGAAKQGDVFAFLTAAPLPSGLPAGKTRKNITSMLATTSILAFLWHSPIGVKNFPTAIFQKDARANAFRKMIKNIPPDVSVATHTNLVPHISNREHVYMLGYEPKLADVALADGADYFGFPNPKTFQQHIQKCADSGKYKVDIIDDRYYILKKIK